MTIYLDDAAVRRRLSIEKLLPAVRQALIDLSSGRVRQPLRMVMDLAAEQSLLFLKPVIAGELLAVKLITQVPANAERGLPTMLATVVLMEASTGRTLAVMEATGLTALRTAAVSAVGIDALASPGAKVLALLGSGALARTHAQALRAVRPISQIRVWSRDARNVEACSTEIGALAAKSAEEAVRHADIVCTLTNAAQPVLKGAWLKEGAVVAAVGAVRPGWRELDDAAMRNVVIADSREAALQEAGDVILSGASVYAEIGEILAGTVPRPAPGTTVIFKPLGQAIVDAAAARLAYETQ
jgi:thiomorpholine-carboxylate dehydrogenase